MSVTRKFIGDIGIRTGFQLLNALKGLLVLPLIARVFGPTGYSLWSQIFLTVALLAPLLTLRLDASLVRYLGGLETRKERSTAFFGSAVVVWALSLAFLALGMLARGSVSFAMFGDRTFSQFAQLFVFLLVAEVNVAYVLSYYRAIQAIRLYTMIQVLQVIVEVSLLYGITLLGTGRLQDVLLGLIVTDVVLLAGMVAGILRREGYPSRPSKDSVRRFLRFSLPLIPAAAMYWVVNSSDRYVIVHFVGLDQAGVYSAAYRVAQILKLMVQPISFVLLPLVSTMWEQGQTDRTRMYLSQSVFWFAMFAVPATAGLIGIGPALLITLGTSDFAVSRGLVALLAFGELFVGIYQIYVYVIYLLERTWIQPLLFTVLALLNLGLNLVLVPRIGILGAAATTCGAYALQALFIIWYTNRLFRITINGRALLKIALGSGCVAVATWLLPGQGVGYLVTAIALGIAVYALVLGLTRAVKIADIRRFLHSEGTTIES